MLDWHEILKIAHVLVIALSAIVSIGCAAVSVVLARRTRSSKVIDDLRAALADGDSELRGTLDAHTTTVNRTLVDHGTRLSILETTVRHMPTHHDLIGIRRELNDLNGTVSALNERSETTHEMVRTIQDYLLEKK